MKGEHSSTAIEASTKKPNGLLSWWLAAGIVGADIGTSVFYSTAVIKPYVGFAAPLIILVVCLLMWLFKTTYVEGCAASPFNGGAYMIALQTLGRRAAMFVGSLTILSYLATAAVSAISGAYYLESFDVINKWSVAEITLVAALPVFFFGTLNIVGIKEPAKLVFAIAFFHFGLLLFLDFYGLWLALTTGADFTRIFKGMDSIPVSGWLHGFAAAFLGITGFESAAQIVEELKAPSWKTLRIVYIVIVCLVGVTAPLTSYLCLILLNDAQLEQYKNSLLSGLAFVEGGPILLKILVVDACLTLFAAVNTAYVGCIGLCTTMAKQGNLPASLLTRLEHKISWLHGYPLVCISFMLVSLMLIVILPGQVENLGQVYGMAFLGVMIAFCAGVMLLRVRMPLKVARAPYRSRWVVQIGRFAVPGPALVGACVLMFAEIVLIVSAEDARLLGLQTLTLILLVMSFYRNGVLESRMTQLPDLRLGLGTFKTQTDLPPDLPAYVLCTGGAQTRRLITQVLNLIESETPGPKEVIIYHAEEEEARRGVMFELLQRVVSQQVAPAFFNRDMILTVKVLPETLIEGLIRLKRKKKFEKIYLGAGHDLLQTNQIAREIETNLGIRTGILSG